MSAVIQMLSPGDAQRLTQRIKLAFCSPEELALS